MREEEGVDKEWAEHDPQELRFYNGANLALAPIVFVPSLHKTNAFGAKCQFIVNCVGLWRDKPWFLVILA